ncbi:MAG TPA: hypothetical protein VGA99_06075 [bacterium]
MANSTIPYINLKLKKNTVDTIRNFFKTSTPEEALDKVAAWLKDKKDENDLLKKYEGKLNVKKIFE